MLFKIQYHPDKDGNAAGTFIPTYLAFPSKRMLPELLKYATPRFDGSVSGTRKGCSNAHIFSTYVETHIHMCKVETLISTFFFYLYDGHRRHISLSLIEWT